jgi:uncharacterized protein (DUF2267 family)
MTRLDGVEMDYDRFLSIVARGAGVDAVAAERATRDVVVTLARRIHRGPRAEVTRHAPEPTRGWFSPKYPREAFDDEEFVRRVATAQEVDVDSAARRVRAVFYALSRAIPADALDPLVAELPKDFDPRPGPARLGDRRRRGLSGSFWTGSLTAPESIQTSPPAPPRQRSRSSRNGSLGVRCGISSTNCPLSCTHPWNADAAKRHPKDLPAR